MLQLAVVSQKWQEHGEVSHWNVKLLQVQLLERVVLIDVLAECLQRSSLQLNIGE